MLVRWTSTEDLAPGPLHFNHFLRVCSKQEKTSVIQDIALFHSLHMLFSVVL